MARLQLLNFARTFLSTLSQTRFVSFEYLIRPVSLYVMVRPSSAATVPSKSLQIMYSTESLSVNNCNTNDQQLYLLCAILLLQQKFSEVASDKEMVPERLYTKINIKVLQYYLILYQSIAC